MSDIAGVMLAESLGLRLPNNGAVPMGNLSLLEAFARRFLDPEDLGYSVSAYTRDQARVALGRQPVESTFPPLRKPPMTNLDPAIESAIVAAGATKAPRITPADIAKNIVHTEIVKHVSVTGQVLRWAVLTTRSGFAVTGDASCSVSSANDRAEIGEQIAIDNAKNALWPLMGYALKQRMHEQANLCQRVTGMNGEICGLQGPCPDCGLTLHDVPEGA